MSKETNDWTSKWADEVFSQEAVHKGSAIFEDRDGANTLKVFPGHTPKTLDIGTWWDGNDGEWTPEYLTVNLDKADVTDLIATLTAWMEN